MIFSDTIAQIATPPGEGAIGIIKISGPDALGLARSIFVGAKDDEKELTIKERYAHYGSIVDPASNETIDDGLLIFMKGPRSFTGEDTVELQCHGGTLVLGQILTLLLSLGARGASAGEFTKRAFLNDRLDLVQAEAVSDLISAATPDAARAARGRLDGALSKKIEAVRARLFGMVREAEASLDFSEEDDVEFDKETLARGACEGADAVVELLSGYDEGSALKDGVRILILGRPNVGKSSLLNLLLREERAIVTTEPGTTRDVIEEALNIRGIPVRLIDTAGLRESEDVVETIGMGRAREKIAEADLILLVVDLTTKDFTEDLAIAGELKGKKVIVVGNKRDLEGSRSASDLEKSFADKNVALISALTGEGLSELEEAVRGEVIGEPGELAPGELIVSARQRGALKGALSALTDAGTALEEGLPLDIVASELRRSLDRVGEITGETTTDDILNSIFSDFCIGK